MPKRYFVMETVWSLVCIRHGENWMKSRLSLSKQSLLKLLSSHVHGVIVEHVYWQATQLVMQHVLSVEVLPIEYIYPYPTRNLLLNGPAGDERGGFPAREILREVRKVDISNLSLLSESPVVLEIYLRRFALGTCI